VEVCLGSYNQLIQRIDLLLEQSTPPVIAISVFCGAGKSTLAERLRQHYQLQEPQVVHIDHLYAENPNGPGVFDQSNWTLLKDIILAFKAGKPLRYCGKGFREEPIPIDAPTPPFLLIEGIRLLQLELMSHFDLSVWIDFPFDQAIARAKARDIAQGEGEAYMKRWDTDWGPKDKAYFDKYQPQSLADFLYQQKN